jgi:hypothetical protein
VVVGEWAVSAAGGAKPTVPAKPKEAWVYLRNIGGLWPGLQVSVFEVHNVEIGDLSTWSDTELALALDEGRRQVDRLFTELEKVRVRGQFLFTSTVALLVVVLAGRYTILAAKNDIPLALWVLGIAVIGLGMLGTASIIVSRKDLRAIDTAMLTTTTERPLLRELVAAHARSVKESTNTVYTQITMFRDAVWVVMVGAIIYGIAWIIATV